MAIDISTNTHAVAFPSRLVAGYGGGHIFDIQLTSAADNGNIVGRGNYIKLGTYAEAAAAGSGTGAFAGKIVEQAANGNWYVEVTAETDALFVYMPQISPYTGGKLKDPKLFYNATGDVVKGYSLHKGDIFEVSAAGFTGTPVVGKTVSVGSKKLVVAS